MVNDATSYVCILCGEWMDQRARARVDCWMNWTVTRLSTVPCRYRGYLPALLGFLLLLVAARGFIQDEKTTELDRRFEDDDGLESGSSGIIWLSTSCSWLYNLRGPTEYSCKVGVYHLLDYLGFEVYITPSTWLYHSLETSYVYHCFCPCLDCLEPLYVPIYSIHPSFWQD